MRKKLTLEVIVDEKISFRDIERTLNQLDAETEMIEVEEIEVKNAQRRSFEENQRACRKPRLLQF